METKVLIAEDNTFIFSCYQEFLSKDKTIEIVGHAQDGKQALEMYKNLTPNILILDLGLPKKNGIELLNEITNFEGTNHKCNVIVISGKPELRNSLFNTKKVFSIIHKPAPLDYLAKIIKDIQAEQIINDFPEYKCQEILLKLNLIPFSKNGRLLIEAIRMCYYDYNFLDNMNKLYDMLGENSSVPPYTVKSSIRTIIDLANRNNDIVMLKKIFSIANIDTKKYVSPKIFINGMVIQLKKYQNIKRVS